MRQVTVVVRRSRASARDVAARAEARALRVVHRAWLVVAAAFVAAACAAGPAVQMPGAIDVTDAEASAEVMTDAFAWSPACAIDWSDFRGRPNMASTAAAMTAYSITSEARCDEGRFTFQVESYFLPARSWVKSAHLLERASDRTLQHERTHFDLREVQARRARLGLAALESPCELPHEVRDRLVAPYLAGDAEVQARYDRETIHGTHGFRQAEWDARVRAWLLELPR